jgi:hypothetical protein
LATPFRTVKGIIWAQIHRRRPQPPRHYRNAQKGFPEIGAVFLLIRKKNHAAPQQINKTPVDEERRPPILADGSVRRTGINRDHDGKATDAPGT